MQRPPDPPAPATVSAPSRTPLVAVIAGVIAMAALGAAVYYWKFVRTPSSAPVATLAPAPSEPIAAASPEPPPAVEPAAPGPEPEVPATAAVTESLPPPPAAEPSPPAKPMPGPAPLPEAPVGVRVPRQPAGLPPEIAARIRTMLGQGRAYKDQLQYDKAIATAESVLVLDPANREATRLINEAKAGQQAALKSIQIE